MVKKQVLKTKKIFLYDFGQKAIDLQQNGETYNQLATLETVTPPLVVKKEGLKAYLILNTVQICSTSSTTYNFQSLCTAW